jgi:hypothetical protein
MHSGNLSWKVTVDLMSENLLSRRDLDLLKSDLKTAPHLTGERASRLLTRRLQNEEFLQEVKDHKEDKIGTQKAKLLHRKRVHEISSTLSMKSG